MKYREDVKKVVLYRYLVSKIVYDKEGLGLPEWIALHDLHYLLTGSSDLNFLRKYDELFNFVELHILPAVKDVREFPVHLKQEHGTASDLEALKFFPSRSAYFGLRNDEKITSAITLRLRRALPPQHLPAKRYIGVGYRDHGCMKDVAKDGSPHWTEVSRYFSNLERIEEEAGE